MIDIFFSRYLSILLLFIYLYGPILCTACRIVVAQLCFFFTLPFSSKMIWISVKYVLNGFFLVIIELQQPRIIPVTGLLEIQISIGLRNTNVCTHDAQNNIIYYFILYKKKTCSPYCCFQNEYIISDERCWR